MNEDQIEVTPGMYRAFLMLQEICGLVRDEIKAGNLNTVEEAVAFGEDRYQDMLKAFDSLAEKTRGTPAQLVMEMANEGKSMDEILGDTKSKFIELHEELTEAVRAGSGEMFSERKVH